MAKDKVLIEVWSEWLLKKTTFLWLPVVAFIKIVQKIRRKQ